jgi:hypothetical protein
MDDKQPVHFDDETVAMLREVLDDAWACLRPEQQATMQKTTMAERILNLRLRTNVIASVYLMPRWRI